MRYAQIITWTSLYKLRRRVLKYFAQQRNLIRRRRIYSKLFTEIRLNKRISFENAIRTKSKR